MAYPEYRSISETALPDVGAHPAPLLAPPAPWVLIQSGDAPWGLTGEAVCSLISANGSCCPAGRSRPPCLQRGVLPGAWLPLPAHMVNLGHIFSADILT